MKRMIAVAVLSAIVLSVCTGCILYVNHATGVLCQRLEESIEYAKQQDMDRAYQALLHTADAWNRHRRILMMYIEQDLLDEVDNQMEYLKALTLYHEEEFVPAAVLCMAQLREIRQRENVSLDSWF